MSTKKRERVLATYSTIVRVAESTVLNAVGFSPLQYEVETFAQWYYNRYAKVYLSKPIVYTEQLYGDSGPVVYVMVFEWRKWEYGGSH